MKRLSLIALALCLAAACSKKKTDADLPEGGVVMKFKVDAPKSGGTQAMVQAVQHRLQAGGFSSAEVEARGGNLIQVKVPGIDKQGVSLIRDLLTRPTRVAFSQAEDGREFFSGLKDKLPQDGSIGVGFDTYSRGDGSVEETYFLLGREPAKLKTYLATLTPPAGQKLWMLPGTEKTLVYLIKDPPTMAKAVVTESKVIQDETSTVPQVAITFDEESKKAFAELTRKSLHRRLAILVDDKISSLPVVQEAIESGQARIFPSPVNQGPATRQEALALAAGIKAWSLAGGLTLVEHQFIKPVE